MGIKSTLSETTYSDEINAIEPGWRNFMKNQIWNVRRKDEKVAMDYSSTNSMIGCGWPF